jgi:hypothetical protein
MLTGFLLMAIGAAMIMWGSAEVWMPVFNDWLRGARNVWDELVTNGGRRTNGARDEDRGFRYAEEDGVAWDEHRRASRAAAATWRENLARDDAT